MSSFEETIGYLLVQLMKRHRAQAEAGLSALGLHVGQEMVLLRLWDDDGLTQSQIADHLCVEPPTVTKMVQRMEAAGLVERRQDAEDARVSRVYLTEHSRNLKPDVMRVWSDLEAQTIRGMTEMEQMLLRRLLQMRDNLSNE